MAIPFIKYGTVTIYSVIISGKICKLHELLPQRNSTNNESKSFVNQAGLPHLIFYSFTYHTVQKKFTSSFWFSTDHMTYNVFCDNSIKQKYFHKGSVPNSRALVLRIYVQ
jgi:hypothetical protein